MLPKHAHKHDVDWLKQQLNRLPVSYRAAAINGYDTVYELYDRENDARREANTRLRKYIERVLAI